MVKKKTMKTETKVQETLAELDVDMVGVALIKDIQKTKLKEDVLKLLPSAKSIAVLGMEIFPEFLDLTKPEMTAGTANLNDLLVRHKDYLRGKMNKATHDIAYASHREGLKALPLPGYGPAVDRRFLEAVISYKDAAVAAGLGSIGMNSLLVTEKYGPRVSLTVCLTEASLKSTAGEVQQNCQFCNICVLKCPAHALEIPKKGEAYVINKFACRNYIEATGGCSECMRVCPVASPIYD